MSSPYRSDGVQLCTSCKHAVPDRLCGGDGGRWEWNCAASPKSDPLQYVAGVDVPDTLQACVTKRDGPTCPEFEEQS